MQPIEQALKEAQALHEQLTGSPAPEITPQAFLPFPVGQDPVAYAIEEVARLKQMLEMNRGSGLGMTPQWVPPASVYAGESSVTFVVELPGIDKEDVDVTVAAEALIIRGRRNPERDPGQQPVVVEQAWGPFERRFPLPAWAHADAISATYSQGVLQVTVTRSDQDATGEFRVEID